MWNKIHLSKLLLCRLRSLINIKSMWEDKSQCLTLKRWEFVVYWKRWSLRGSCGSIHYPQEGSDLHRHRGSWRTTIQCCLLALRNKKWFIFHFQICLVIIYNSNYEWSLINCPTSTYEFFDIFIRFFAPNR